MTYPFLTLQLVAKNPQLWVASAFRPLYVFPVCKIPQFNCCVLLKHMHTTTVAWVTLDATAMSASAAGRPPPVGGLALQVALHPHLSQHLYTNSAPTDKYAAVELSLLLLSSWHSSCTDVSNYQDQVCVCATGLF